MPIARRKNFGGRRYEAPCKGRIFESTAGLGGSVAKPKKEESFFALPSMFSLPV
jgi:hypothetical protein